MSIDYIKTTKQTFFQSNTWIYSILTLFMICSILFTLLSAIPLNEETDPHLLSFDPEAAGIFYLCAGMSAFLSIFCLLIMYFKKVFSKILLSCLLLCLCVSGYRMISIQQYDDYCKHVQTSLCVVGKPKSFPLW